MHRAVAAYGVELQGAGCDEAPMVYRKLPVGVAMAGENEIDPYKD